MARNKKTHNDDQDVLIIKEPDITGLEVDDNIEEKVQEELSIQKPEIIKTTNKVVKKSENKIQGLADFLY